MRPGVKRGTLLGARATDALSIGGGVAWYGLYRARADNSANGTIDSHGLASNE